MLVGTSSIWNSKTKYKCLILRSMISRVPLVEMCFYGLFYKLAIKTHANEIWIVLAFLEMNEVDWNRDRIRLPLSCKRVVLYLNLLLALVEWIWFIYRLCISDILIIIILYCWYLPEKDAEVLYGRKKGKSAYLVIVFLIFVLIKIFFLFWKVNICWFLWFLKRSWKLNQKDILYRMARQLVLQQDISFNLFNFLKVNSKWMDKTGYFLV